MDKNTVMEFVKTHEKKIRTAGIITGAVGATIAGYVFLGKRGVNIKPWKEVSVPDWGVGNLCKVMMLDGKDMPDFSVSVEDLKIADLGRLGDELHKLGAVNSDSYAEVILFVGEKA